MTQKLMKWLHIFVVLVLLNLLWLTGTILGIFFLGLVPSTQSIVSLIIHETIFDPYTSYLSIIKKFSSYYWNNLKRYHIKSIIVPVGLVVIYIDFQIVQLNAYLRSLIQYPLLIFSACSLIVFLNWLIARAYSKDSTMRVGKFALLTPFILPVQTLLSLLLGGAFIIFSLKWSWFQVFGFTTLIVVITKMFNETLLKKGLIKINE